MTSLNRLMPRGRQRQLTCMLDPRAHAALAALAQKHQTTISAVVRVALDDFIEVNMPAALEEREEKQDKPPVRVKATRPRAARTAS